MFVSHICYVNRFVSYVIVPAQENGVDCALFVCRYASAMYYLQDVDIKFADVVKEQPPLMNKLSLSPYFRFDQSEITKFRAELVLLIRELSRIYLTRNEISLLSQEDEENSVAGTKGTEEKTAIENEAAVFEEELQLALASEDEKELDLAIASEQDNVAVVTNR